MMQTLENVGFATDNLPCLGRIRSWVGALTVVYVLRAGQGVSKLELGNEG